MTASRARTWVQGVVALVALIVVVVGVPIWLDAVAGSPIPRTVPDLDQLWTSLTRRDDGTLLLAVVKYAAWAGWAFFVGSVLADVVTRMRGLPAPRLGPQQHLATQLVSAVIALAVTLPTSMAASAAPMSTTRVALSAGVVPAGAGADDVRQAPTPTDPAAAVQPYEEYTVRRGDCLWDIAWNELGEPERWPEIYEASRRLAQPHGRLLSDPDLILPGWVLHIPVPTTTAERRTAEDPHPAQEVPSESATIPRESRVVTPLLGPASGSTQEGRSTPAEPASSPQVITRLRTLRPTTTVSALEERWIHALAEHDDSDGLAEDWRRRLANGE